ncbi:MAG: hypothetical protein AAFY41_05145 [Bacteroidota bacterium]
MGTSTSSYKAVGFQAPEGAEIMGSALKGYFDIFTPTITKPILKEHGLTAETIHDEHWYPLQIGYDIEKAGFGDSTIGMDSVAMGKMVASTIIESDTMPDLETYLTVYINQITVISLRNIPDELGYIVEKIAEKDYRITSNVPSTNEAVFGFMWESCRLLKEPDETFFVHPISGYPGNQERIVLEVKWGHDIS